MDFGKIMDYLRQCVLLFLVIYLVKKFYELERKVYYLTLKINQLEVVEEYSTDEISLNPEKSKKEVFSDIFVNLANQEVPQETHSIAKSTIKTEEPIFTESNPFSKKTLKELQALAIEREIEIKVNGKNKTKKQLLEELKIIS